MAGAPMMNPTPHRSKIINEGEIENFTPNEQTQMLLSIGGYLCCLLEKWNGYQTV